MTKMEIHTYKPISPLLMQKSASLHEMRDHFLPLFHPYFRYNVKQIFHPVLTQTFINHALYSFTSHLSLSVENFSMA